MKNIFFLLIGLFFISSCSHRIVRKGYARSTASNGNCEVSIKKDFEVTENFTKLGDIKLGESGFSARCTEEHAMEILKREACALDADLVNITREVRADIMSSCYRCSATFYKATNAENKVAVASDARYDNKNVEKRVRRDRNTNTGWIIAGIVTGVVLAVLTGPRR